MRFLKSKILWFSIYAIGITGVFLYVLFPSTLVLQKLEDSAGSAGIVLKAGSLHPSLPLGIKLKNLTVRPASAPAGVFVQGELLDLQLNPVSIFRKNKTIHFQGNAYSGQFDGYAAFLSFTRVDMPAEVKINFQNIDLARYNPPGFPFFKGMTGLARGSAFYVKDAAASRNPIGKLSLYLSRGAYPLPEPFLGVNSIEFDRGEIQGQLKNDILTIRKFEIYGTQVNCFFSGDIALAERVGESRINLKGVLEIAGKSKIKMNVTVGGTLANPSFRYI